jgi:hypothetical protein
MQLTKSLAGSLLLAATLSTFAQRPNTTNYDEAKVGNHPLPDPLTFADGSKVADAKAWQTKRRAEVVRLFETHVYGRSPARPAHLVCEVTKTDPQALGGKATRKEITIWLTGKKDGPRLDLQLFVPNGVKGPVPAFLGCNFNGNHAVHADPSITLNPRWMRNSQDKKSVVDNRATEASRGSEASRWQVEMVIAKGYALATYYYGDVEPDHAEGWKTGLRAALAKDGASTQFAPDAWGAIGAWAWGLSRGLDYLETDKAIDAKQVAVIGHSRLGKTSLWAGAADERFAMVISNNSGEGGASISRRDFGETIAVLNKNFPHWFCGNYKLYTDAPEKLPVDMHQLAALAAPRPLYIASADEDKWADPKGEFLAGKLAEPVYALFGKKGTGVTDWPSVDQPVGETIGYHVRTGKHDVTAYDWEQYLKFADKHFKRAK